MMILITMITINRIPAHDELGTCSMAFTVCTDSSHSLSHAARQRQTAVLPWPVDNLQ